MFHAAIFLMLQFVAATSPWPLDPFADPAGTETGWRWLATGVTLTLLWWLAAWPAALWLDRRTCGYRRPLVLAVTGTVWLVGTLVIWLVVGPADR